MKKFSWFRAIGFLAALSSGAAFATPGAATAFRFGIALGQAENHATRLSPSQSLTGPALTYTRIGLQTALREGEALARFNLLPSSTLIFLDPSIKEVTGIYPLTPALYWRIQKVREDYVDLLDRSGAYGALTALATSLGIAEAQTAAPDASDFIFTRNALDTAYRFAAAKSLGGLVSISRISEIIAAYDRGETPYQVQLRIRALLADYDRALHLTPLL